MKFYSDVTKQLYDSKEDCYAAEKAYEEKVAAEKAKKAELENSRKNDAKALQELENSYTQLVRENKAKEEELAKKIVAARNEFIKKYGSYHVTYSNIMDDISPLFKFFF